MHDIQTEDKHVKLETLFDAHLSAHQNPEPIPKAPVDSYIALTNAIVERDDAFKKIGYSDYRVPQGLTTCHGILFFALQYKI